MVANEEARQSLFAYFERFGVERIEHDLLWTRGLVYVGTIENQDVAWEWVRMKKAAQATAQEKRDVLFQFKPAIWGIGININELWRRLKHRCAANQVNAR